MNKKLAICMAVMLTMPLNMGFKTGENTESGGNVQNTSNIGETANSEVTEPFTTSKDSKIETKIETEKTADNSKVETQKDETKSRNTFQSAEMMKEYISQFNGKTIVNIEYEGASEATLPTVKSVIMAHVGDEFNADIAMRDRDAILNTGYFYESYQTFREVPEGVLVTYHAMENPVYKNLDISGNTIYKTEDLTRMITLRRNNVLNRNTLQDNLAAIEEKYRGDGYILMRFSDMNVSPEGTLTLKINEGTLEGYSVKGNKKTKDYVILREMRQKVGEPFNAKLAQRSMDRVYNLGFFEDVNIKMNPGVEPNAVIMEINVKERRTGTFGIGAGYSTRDGFLGNVTIADRNFLGRGDAISLTFEKSAEETDAHGISFSYRKPWLDKKETAATFRFYNRTYQYYDYNTEGNLNERYMRRYLGGEITLSRPQSEYSTNYLTIRHRKDTYVRHVAWGLAGDRSLPYGDEWRNANFGTTRSIIFQHVTDTRDNIYNPTTGGKVSLSAEFGGWLGGDFNFQKYDIEHQQFYKAGNHSQVWAGKVAYGYGHGDLTEFNQFRLGGQSTLRGYRDDQFRGSRMALATLEYRFPLAKKVQGIVFTDWGGAWSSGFFPKGNSIYGSVGVGVALNTPLGPLRLDYGRGKQGGRFHFNIGGGF